MPAKARSATLLWLEPSGERRSAIIQVQSATAEGMVVHMAEPIAVDRAPRVRWDQNDRRAVVCHCSSQGSEYLVVLYFLVRERRGEDRVPASGMAKLTWTDRSGRRHIWVVAIKDIGEGGMGVEVPQAVDFPQVVRLTGETWECLGWIRHCEKKGANFLAGIQFIPPGISSRTGRDRDPRVVGRRRGTSRPGDSDEADPSL